MELAGVVDEDDVFYADLTQRISLLITEDEHEEDLKAKWPARVPVQAHCHALSQPSSIAPSPPFLYEAAHMKGSKGTGVFIPKSSSTKRRNRSGGRSKSSTVANNKAAATSVPSNANAATHGGR